MNNTDDMVDLDGAGDYKCNGSVLEKLSMFEKLDQRQANVLAQIPVAGKQYIHTHDNESTANMKRTDYLSKSMRLIDKEAGDIFIYKKHT